MIKVPHIDDGYEFFKDAHRPMRDYLFKKGVEILPEADFGKAMDIFNLYHPPAIIIDIRKRDDEKGSTFPGLKIIEELRSYTTMVIVYTVLEEDTKQVKEAKKLGAKYIKRIPKDETYQKIYDSIMGKQTDSA
jgi:DNA-binding response OmpR family regulator